MVVFCVTLNPFSYETELGIAQRINVALTAAVVPALFLVVSIVRLAVHRFFSPEDIDGGGLFPNTERAALLQNTLEQAVVAVAIYCIWSVLAPSDWLSVVPMAALLFCFGRILFFLGYQRGAATRAFGFTLSFYPSLVMLVVILGLLLEQTWNWLN